MIEKIDQIARAAHVSAQRANRLGQRSHLNIDASVNVEVIDRASSIAPQHAGSMRVVDHHDRAVFFREIAQRRQWTNVAIHREHSVGDQQLLARLAMNAG